MTITSCHINQYANLIYLIDVDPSPKLKILENTLATAGTEPATSNCKS